MGEKSLDADSQGESGHGTSDATLLRASATFGLGQYQMALNLSESAWMTLRAKHGEDHPFALYSRHAFAACLDAMGRHEEACAEMDQVLEGYKLLYPHDEQHPALLDVSSERAALEDEAGHQEDALPPKVSGLDGQRARLGGLQPETLTSMDTLACSYTRLARSHETRYLLLNAYETSRKPVGDETLTSLEYLAKIASLSRDEGHFPLAEWLSRLQAESALEVAGEGHSAYILSLLQLANSIRLRGLSKESERVAQKATKLADRYLGKTNPITLGARLSWIAALRLEGHLGPAERMVQYLQDQEVCPRGKNSWVSFAAKRELCLIHDERGLINLALSGLRSLRQAAGLELPSNSRLLNELDLELANTLLNYNRFSDAVPAATRAAEAFAETYGPEYYVTIRAERYLGLALNGLHDTKAAKKILLRAVRIAQKRWGGHDVGTWYTRSALSTVLVKAGSPADAAALLKLNLEGMKATLSPDDPTLTATAARLKDLAVDASNASSVSDPDLAQILDDEAAPEAEILRIYRQAEGLFGSDHRLTLRIKLEVARHHHREERLAEAEECLRAVFETQVKKLGEGDRDTLQTVRELGRVHPGSLSETATSQCLHWALDRADVALLKDFLQGGGDPSVVQTDAPRLTALSHAVQAKSHDAVRVLLEHGCEVNVADESVDAPIHLAVSGEDLALVELLLKHGADPMALDSNECSPLYLAALRGNEALVRALLRAGVRPYKDKSNPPAIHAAAKAGSISIIELLLDSEVELEAKEDGGFTPFLTAVCWGKVDAARWLRDNGANIHAVEDKDGLNALELACSEGEAAMVEYLLELDFDPTKQSRLGPTPAHLAVVRGYVDVLDVLLVKRKAVDLNIRYAEEEWTLLASAARYNQAAAVRWLIQQGSPPDEPLGGNVTALYVACGRGHVEVAKELVDAGADPNILTADGWTPLLAAIDSGNLELVKVLLAAGYRAVDGVNRTPLWFACWQKEPELVKLLLDKDLSDLNTQEKETLFAPLHTACYKNSAKIVLMLLESGADPNLVAWDGATPLHMAIGHQNTEIAGHLIRYGAELGIRDCYGRTPAAWAATVTDEAARAFIADPGLPVQVPSDEVFIHNTICKAIQEIKKTRGFQATLQAWLLGRSLLFRGDEKNAQLALEMHFSGFTRAIDDTCDSCAKKTPGPVFVCKTCRDFDMCTAFHEKRLWGKTSPMCGHSEFLQVPRPFWKHLPPDAVELDGTTIDQWLAHLEAKYDAGTKR